jgi:excisionase family DNA binding protein
MSAALQIAAVPRYGSAAQLAVYSGLSVKTVRRLVDAGRVRGLKVGRRLLIPFEDLDRHVVGQAVRPAVGRNPVMASAPAIASPHRSVDASGRALPMTDAEIRARNAVAIRALDAIAEMGDEDEQQQTLDALMIAIDAEPLSNRKRFR